MGLWGEQALTKPGVSGDGVEGQGESERHHPLRRRREIEMTELIVTILFFDIFWWLRR